MFVKVTLGIFKLLRDYFKMFSNSYTFSVHSKRGPISLQIEGQLDVDAMFILRRRFMMVCNRVRIVTTIFSTRFVSEDILL